MFLVIINASGIQMQSYPNKIQFNIIIITNQFTIHDYAIYNILLFITTLFITCYYS